MIRILFILACLALPGLALPARAELKIQQVTSPGGITAWLVEDHNIPFTALEIQFRGGTSLDAPGKRGAVNLMAALIEEGAGDMDSVAFAEARDALAAEFHFNAHGDGLGISARFLTENRDAAVDLLQQALVRPRFDQDAVDRVRGQVMSILRSNEKDPNALASEAFAALAESPDREEHAPRDTATELHDAVRRQLAAGILDQIGPGYRRLIERVVFEGLTSAQIAE
ncbi:MAG TPA: hypothetical protein PKA03_16520, partial [Tabrizicola sp.]|nr:hypothetical protein [Tabrizicola sp.]